jgi:hypothetical protein
MTRLLFCVLMVSASVALAEEKPKAKHTAATAALQMKTEAVNGQTEQAQTKTKVAQGQTDEAEATVGQVQAPTEEPQASTEEGTKLTSVPGGKALGMSILGNQDAPKSLVIVPWKSSELGDSRDISPMLDDSRQPVDKEVFMRALRYYEIRTGTKP